MIYFSGPSSSVFEVEISPSEFFQDLGVMVIEGRVPELTASGRRTGIHSWPLTNNSKKSCCFKTNIQEEVTILCISYSISNLYSIYLIIFIHS